MCLRYIDRSSRQAMGFKFSMNLYDPIDICLSLVQLSTSLYPLVVKLSEKSSQILEILRILFFYQHSLSLGSNGMLSRVFWDMPPY